MGIVMSEKIGIMLSLMYEGRRMSLMYIDIDNIVNTIA